MATQSSPFSSPSPYPFAAAPDIVRSHQKDASFTTHLADSLADIHRRILGARSAHHFAPELRSLAALLYFALTTLPGNRTLGEEYCDLVQVNGSASQAGTLPTLRTRAAYIAGTILLPYVAGRVLPALRARLRAALSTRLDTLRRRDASASAPTTSTTSTTGAARSREAKMWQYVLDHMPLLTSAAPAQAVTLALFYFSGTYYELGKRVLGLRYVFTRSVPDTPDRSGYEILGILLAAQLAVQGYLHIRDAFSAPQDDKAGEKKDGKMDVAKATHTPVLGGPRFCLEQDTTMGYIKGAQQRKCTLCLEDMRDPAATQCGHVFCWECIGDWVKEKPECPLCRREAMVQHILPLRVI